MEFIPENAAFLGCFPRILNCKPYCSFQERASELRTSPFDKDGYLAKSVGLLSLGLLKSSLEQFNSAKNLFIRTQ